MFKMLTANLMSENVDETVKFYSDVLGFSVAASVKNEKNGALDFVILTKDNQSLMFQNRESIAAEYSVMNFAKTQPSATLYITVDNFTGIYEEIKKKCNIMTDIHTAPYGMKEFAITDNNGYVVTIAEHKE